MAIALVIALGTGSESSAPVPDRTSTASGGHARLVGAGADSCRQLRKALRYYRMTERGWRARMGAAVKPTPRLGGCPRYLASLWRAKARAARLSYERWRHYHFAWWDWMPDKWARIGACETGYGQRPGRWDWNSGTYQGAFGFYHGSWDAFVPYADRKARPYPSEAYNATPRQQYEVALAIYRRYGLTGWGCRNA